MRDMTKIGIEYGLLPSLIFLESNYSIPTHVLETQFKVLKKKRKLSPEIWSMIYNDVGATEFVTKPISLKQTLKGYKEVKKVAKELNLNFHLSTKEKHYCSGGMHINLDVPKKDREAVKLHLMIDLNNKPYMNWCLNDPSDDENANSLINNFQNFKVKTGKKIERSTYDWFTGRYIKYYEDEFTYKELTQFEYWIQNGISALKLESPVCYRGNRFEFRLFDTPKNDQEFKGYLNVALALRERAIKNARLKKGYPKAQPELLKISKEKAWNLFVNEIKELKIPNPPMNIWRKRLNARFQFIKDEIVIKK